jgi:hypothetical protein
VSKSHQKARQFFFWTIRPTAAARVLLASPCNKQMGVNREFTFCAFFYSSVVFVKENSAQFKK